MSAKQPIGFDPLDMNNYSLEKFKEIKSGRFMGYMKLVGVPLAIFLFVFFHFQWCGKIDMLKRKPKCLQPRVIARWAFSWPRWFYGLQKPFPTI